MSEQIRETGGERLICILCKHFWNQFLVLLQIQNLFFASNVFWTFFYPHYSPHWLLFLLFGCHRLQLNSQTAQRWTPVKPKKEQNVNRSITLPDCVKSPHLKRYQHKAFLNKHTSRIWRREFCGNSAFRTADLIPNCMRKEEIN